MNSKTNGLSIFWVILLSAISIAMLNVGCGNESASKKGENSSVCILHTDCPLHYECSLEGVCQYSDKACDYDSDCPQGYYCHEHGICLLSPIDGDEEEEKDADTTDELDTFELAEEEALEENTSENEQPEVVQETDTNEMEEEIPSRDSDGDGIPDALEDKNGNGHWDVGETDLFGDDTDGDGIKDGDEDRNHNGRRDPGELDPTAYDSDYDGLRDGEEDTNHNGIYEPDTDFSDPLNPDTDGDGLFDGVEAHASYTNGGSDPKKTDTDGDGVSDGEEDRNGNGEYEPDLGETDPTMYDSDGDGVPDGQEGQSIICQSDQVREVTLVSSASGHYTLALSPQFDSYQLLTFPSNTVNGVVFNSSLGIAGFLLSEDLTPYETDVNSEVQAFSSYLSTLLPQGTSPNHRSRTYTSYDGFPADTSHFTLNSLSQPTSLGQLRDTLIEHLSNYNTSQIQGLIEDPGNQDSGYEIVIQTLFREEDGTLIKLVAIAPLNLYQSNTNEQIRIITNDLTNGTALSVADNTTKNKCDPYSAEGTGKVDFLWLIDPSGSMSGDKEAVIQASDDFFGVLESTGFDFRIAVTSFACVEDSAGLPPLIPPSYRGELAEHGFTNVRSEFESDVRNLPCSGVFSSIGEESGLLAGTLTIMRAFCQVPGMPCALGQLNPAPICPNECLRSDAAIIVVFISDEEEESYERKLATNPQDAQQYLNDMIMFYTGITYPFPYDHPIAFAVVGDIPNGCTGPGDRSADEAGSAYISVAQATGGGFGSVCSVDMQPTFDEIIRAAASFSSSFNLRNHPISSTIRVTINGQEVPRSYQNGFEYDVVSENIIFYGSTRPANGDDVVISYKFFSDDIKDTN